MSIPAHLAQLVGAWSGRNQLWMSPSHPALVSDGTATVTLAVRDQVLAVRYTWAEHDQPQEGLLVVQYDAATGVATAAWTDSWHLRDTFMACKGTIDATGLSVDGTYAAPPGPDWGWRLTIEPHGSGRLRLRMFNISPSGQTDLAVEAVYDRSIA
jgi:hypothetical protein